MDRILVTAVGGPPGRNALLALKSTGRYDLYVADADPMAVSLYDQGLPSYVFPPANDDSFVSTLEKVIRENQIQVVLPCIEPEIEVMVANARQIRAAGAEILAPEKGVLGRGLHKGDATVTAGDVGVGIPRTLSIKTGCFDRSSAETFVDSLDTGVVVKPSVSHGMKGVLLTEDVEAALQYAGGLPCDFVIQELIPAKTGAMHMVGMVYDGAGNLCRSFVSRSICTLFENGGPATGGVSIECPELIEKTAAVLQAVGRWKGPAGVEWMLDPRDGEFKFVEINPRIWGYSSLATGAGANFASYVVDLALGKDIGPDPGYKKNVAMLRTFQDVIFEQPDFPYPSSQQE